jgi:hypothetical protein
MERYGGGHGQQMHVRSLEVELFSSSSFFVLFSLNFHRRWNYRINVAGAAQSVDVHNYNRKRGLWNVPHLPRKLDRVAACDTNR